jgi:predicted nucleotidyltransferase
MTFVKLTPCRKALLKTLSYSGVFKYPLSYYQIYNYLISSNWFSGKQIRKEVRKLVKQKVVCEKEGRYFLSAIEPIDTNERVKETNLSLKRNAKLFETLQKIPWIKMVAVTGSAANYNNDKGSDLDLLFLTSKNRVWLTRGFVFLILKLMNKLPKNQAVREICPNIFIDETHMPWAKKKRNLYVAQNIVSMQPIIDEGETYFRFVGSNKWVNDYYTNFKVTVIDKPGSNHSTESVVMNIVEKLAMKMQVYYMKNKMTSEVASNNLIHFKKNDNSSRILSAYKSIFRKYRSA